MSEVTDEPTPGSGIFGPSVDAFDERVDQLLEIVRSSKPLVECSWRLVV